MKINCNRSFDDKRFVISYDDTEKDQSKMTISELRELATLGKENYKNRSTRFEGLAMYRLACQEILWRRYQSIYHTNLSTYTIEKSGLIQFNSTLGKNTLESTATTISITRDPQNYCFILFENGICLGQASTLSVNKLVQLSILADKMKRRKVTQTKGALLYSIVRIELEWIVHKQFVTYGDIA